MVQKQEYEQALENMKKLRQKVIETVEEHMLSKYNHRFRVLEIYEDLGNLSLKVYVRSLFDEDIVCECTVEYDGSIRDDYGYQHFLHSLCKMTTSGLETKNISSIVHAQYIGEAEENALYVGDMNKFIADSNIESILLSIAVSKEDTELKNVKDILMQLMNSIKVKNVIGIYNFTPEAYAEIERRKQAGEIITYREMKAMNPKESLSLVI